MSKDSTFDKIEAWLSGELTDNEARAFSAEIDASSDLAAEVEQHRTARQAIDRLREINLQSDMAKWRENMDDLPEPPAETPPPGTSTLSGTTWIYTLALLLIVTAGAIWYFRAPSANVQDSVPPAPVKLPKSDIPVAQQHPIPDSAEPVAQQQPQYPSTQPKDHRRELVAIADARLIELRDAVSLQYGQTMGTGDADNPDFEAGLSAYKNKQFKEAIRYFLKIQESNAYYIPTQELLAILYFKEKNYSSAVGCYEKFAAQNQYPEVDWRLLQFYLADYQNSRNKFWAKMKMMRKPGNAHKYQTEAESLEQAIKKMGITE